VGPIAEHKIGTREVTTEGPGLSAFALSEGVVYHTYSSYAPESNFMRRRRPGRRHDEYEGAH
jgi:hypothetical protein